MYRDRAGSITEISPHRCFLCKHFDVFIKKEGLAWFPRSRDLGNQAGKFSYMNTSARLPGWKKKMLISMRFCRRRAKLASFRPFSRLFCCCRNDFLMLNECRWHNFQNYCAEKINLMCSCTRSRTEFHPGNRGEIRRQNSSSANRASPVSGIIWKGPKSRPNLLNDEKTSFVPYNLRRQGITRS